MASVFESGSESPAEALFRAVRRSWRVVESDLARTPRETVAPAAAVARAVGALALEAATHGAGNAAPGAVAGCGEGVMRAVDGALARLVLEAIPGRVEREREEDEALGGPRPRLDGAEPPRMERVRGRLPAAGWWEREAAWSPRIAGDATEAGLGPLWPRVPDGPSVKERRARVTGGPANERRLVDHAWRTLERELEPVARGRGRTGGGW